MPKEFARHSRVAQFLKQELAVLIQIAFPLSDYGMITLTNVEVSPDLRHATVYVTILKPHRLNQQNDQARAVPNQDQTKLMTELNKKAGYFRHKLSHSLVARGVPLLHFKYDDRLERAQHLTDLIDSVNHHNESC